MIFTQNSTQYMSRVYSVLDICCSQFRHKFHSGYSTVNCPGVRNLGHTCYDFLVTQLHDMERMLRPRWLAHWPDLNCCAPNLSNKSWDRTDCSTTIRGTLLTTEPRNASLGCVGLVEQWQTHNIHLVIELVSCQNTSRRELHVRVKVVCSNETVLSASWQLFVGVHKGFNGTALLIRGKWFILHLEK